MSCGLFKPGDIVWMVSNNRVVLSIIFFKMEKEQMIFLQDEGDVYRKIKLDASTLPSIFFTEEDARKARLYNGFGVQK